MCRCGGGRLRLDETLRILEPVIRALATVHKTGLVHRDISPDNIILHPLGGAKILDFGAVRNVGDPNAEKDLTHSTEAILKHGFAPMEQYRSRGSLGPWTDEYALCGTIYYCVTGRVPPDAPARSMGEVQPDWDDVAGLTESQRYALEKGMAMAAKDRFPNMEEFHTALFHPEQLPAREKEQEKKKDEKPGAGKKKIWIPIAAALLIIVAAAAFLIPKFLTPGPQDPILSVPETTAPELTTTVPTVPETEPPTVPETEPPTVPETEPPTEPETEPPTEPETEPYVPSEPWELNVLMADPLSGLKIARQDIRQVTFLDTLTGLPEVTFDLSKAQDGSVLAWVEKEKVFIAAEGGINARESCSGLFRDCKNLEKVTFGKHFHTEQTTSMDNMFYSCVKLVFVDLENLDTSNVTDMSQMFCMGRLNPSGEFQYAESEFGRYIIPAIDKWDISQVRDMSRMFFSCGNLQTLNISGWNVSNVEKMGYAFGCCRSVRSLDIGGWDVSRVQDLSGLFYDCQTLGAQVQGSSNDLKLENWDVSSVRDMSRMFYGCINLNKITITNWDVSSAKDMSQMFTGCERIGLLDMSGWDVSAVENMHGMFSNCDILTVINLRGWNASQVQDMGSMFSGDRSLQTLDTSGWQTSSALKNTNSMFSGCAVLKSVDTSTWDVSGVTNMGSMFRGCHKLQTVDTSGWDVANVTDMDRMFSECMVMHTLDTSKWDTSSCTDMGYMFNSCNSLKVLETGTWNVSEVTDMAHMFYECNNIDELAVAGWNVSKVTDMNHMFFKSGIRDLPAENWDVSNVTDMNNMFFNCLRLQTPDIRGWNTDKVRNYDNFMSPGKRIGAEPWQWIFDDPRE